MTVSDCPFCEQLQRYGTTASPDLIGFLPHSVVVLGPWQYYHGYCLVVCRQHVTELSQLEPARRQGYLEEMCVVARAIEECFRPHKLNYEMLGNQVPHLHWHLFPRYPHDPEKLQPVWLALSRAERLAAERHRLQTGHTDRNTTVEQLRERLSVLSLDFLKPG